MQDRPGIADTIIALKKMAYDALDDPQGVGKVALANIVRDDGREDRRVSKYVGVSLELLNCTGDSAQS